MAVTVALRDTLDRVYQEFRRSLPKLCYPRPKALKTRSLQLPVQPS
ncbi:hypothetical protein [Roseofilum sp. Guam]|nr:hypothetical protein [Roseofilum sp. Guam]MBP0031251.1 hypothetical protein [Roseofilum sp. Guam]